eukprot:UN04118
MVNKTKFKTHNLKTTTRCRIRKRNTIIIYWFTLFISPYYCCCCCCYLEKPQFRFSHTTNVHPEPIMYITKIKHSYQYKITKNKNEHENRHWFAIVFSFVIS